jgi:hypothetical protein
MPFSLTGSAAAPGIFAGGQPQTHTVPPGTRIAFIRDGSDFWREAVKGVVHRGPGLVSESRGDMPIPFSSLTASDRLRAMIAV